MTSESVNMLAAKFDKQVPAVCSFRLRNKLASAPEEKVEEVSNMTLKSRNISLILSVILGWFGIHRFYLGDKKQGIVMLGLCACALVFFSATLIWYFSLASNLVNVLKAQIGDGNTLVSVNVSYDELGEEITSVALLSKYDTVDSLSFSKIFKMVTSSSSQFYIVASDEIVFDSTTNVYKFSTQIPETLEAIQVTNSISLVFDLFAIFSIIVTVAFLAWWIVDLVRCYEDVAFVNYERIVYTATGSKDNPYKAVAGEQ